MNIQDSDLAKEILLILPYLDNKYLDSLSQDFINNLTELAALSNKNYYFTKTPPKLSELSDKCLDFLGLLYYNNTDNSSKNSLLNIWIENEI